MRSKIEIRKHIQKQLYVYVYIKIKRKEKSKLWTLKTALRPSGTLRVEKYTHPRDEYQSHTKGVFGDNSRIRPILDVLVTTQSSRNVFTTVQSQIQPSRRTSRSDTTLGSDRSPWRSYRLLDQSICFQRSCVLSDRKNVNRIHDREKCGSRGKLLISSLHKSIVNSVTLSGGQSCSSGGFTQDTQKLSSSTQSNDDKVHPFKFKDQIIFMWMYSVMDLTQNRNENCMQTKFSEQICLSPSYFRQDGEPSSEREMSKNETGPPPTNLMGCGTPLQK